MECLVLLPVKIGSGHRFRIFALSLILCLSVGYNLGHLEITPERYLNEKYKHLEITDVLELLLVRPLKITPEMKLQREVKRRHFKEKYKHLETIDVFELLQVGPFKNTPESEIEREVKRRNFNQKHKDFEMIDALELLQHELDSVSFGKPNSWDTHDQIDKLLSRASERVLNHGVNVSFTLLVDLITFVILLFMWVLVPSDKSRTHCWGV
ncbi:hypothetical protein AVEN_104038-1 [Araneus ventricosus]|uniref:Uncharacterized protein n=1 Tax=Araneus ventricosus TaxID=182803 RepID=A0A4Y2LLM0_ARAVE|nr:hypothetical protein AVEN_104038-1 [Araneus ventricosus]